LIKRQTDALRIPVPESNVNGADGAHDDAGPAMKDCVLVHGLPQGLDLEWVTAGEKAGKERRNDLGKDRATGAADIAEAEPGGCVVAIDFDQPIVALIHRAV